MTPAFLLCFVLEELFSCFRSFLETIDLFYGLPPSLYFSIFNVSMSFHLYFCFYIYILVYICVSMLLCALPQLIQVDVSAFLPPREFKRSNSYQSWLAISLPHFSIFFIIHSYLNNRLSILYPCLSMSGCI